MKCCLIIIDHLPRIHNNKKNLESHFNLCVTKIGVDEPNRCIEIEFLSVTGERERERE